MDITYNLLFYWVRVNGKMKKKIKRICNNCKLFDAQKSQCNVIILHDGEKHHLPVNPQDRCFFEKEFVAINPDGGIESFKTEIQEVQFWVENPETGEKTDKDGIVKIKYPNGFFGDESEKEST